MDYSEFMPKHQTILVGTTELRVEEYTISKRDAVLKILVSKLDIVTLVKPFFEAFRESKKTGGDIDLNFLEIAAQFKDTILKIVGKDLTEIACLTLDSKKNRTEVNVEDELKINDEHGYEYSEGMFRIIKENLTQRQEQELLASVLKVNDFVGLIKNYKTLVVGMMTATGE